MIDLGIKIKALRTLRGLNQSQLARQAKVGQYLISDIERGRALPSAEIQLAIEAALGIRFDDPDVQAAFAVLAGNGSSQ